MSFYGYSCFHPGLFTEPEALKLKSGLSQDLWALCLDLVGRYNELTIIDVTHRQVVFGTVSGTPALVARYMSNELNLINWTKELKRRGGSRYEIKSKNRAYLLRQINPYIPEIVSIAEQRLAGMINHVASQFVQYLNSDTNDAGSISNQTLKPEELYAALKVLFNDDSVIDIPQNVLQALRTKHSELEKKFSSKKTYTERLNDMFRGEKWVVMHFPLPGKVLPDLPVLIGSAGVLPINQYTAKVAFSEPMRLYRSFDDYYARQPDKADAFKTALMFTKVQADKAGTAQSWDTAGFLPKTPNGFAAYEDVASFSGSQTTPSLQWPQVLMMGK